MNGVALKKLPLPVKADYLAACPEPGVDCKDVLSAEGRGEEELSQIFCKYPYGFLVRPFLYDKSYL